MKFATYKDLMNNIGKNFTIVAKRRPDTQYGEVDNTVIQSAIYDNGAFTISTIYDDITIYPANIDDNGNPIDWKNSEISNQPTDEDWFYDIFWT